MPETSSEIGIRSDARPERLPVRNTDVGWGLRVLGAAYRAEQRWQAEKKEGESPDDARQRRRTYQFQEVATALWETKQTEDAGRPIGVEQAIRDTEELQRKAPEKADRENLALRWAHRLGEESVAPDKTDDQALFKLMDRATQEIPQGKTPEATPYTTSTVTYINAIIPRIQNGVLRRILERIDRQQTSDRAIPGDENKPIFTRDEMASLVERWAGNPQIPEADQGLLLDAQEARDAARPTPQEQYEEAMRMATAAYQHRYYESADVLQESQEAIRFIAQAMAQRKGEERSFGLLGEQSIEVQTIRAFSPESLGSFEEVQRALGILTAALEETSSVKAPNFKSVTSVLDFNLEQAGWADPERIKIINTINFIYYSTIYNSAARDCDKEYGQWKAKIQLQTQTSEKQSKDEFKMSPDMIVAAFDSFREVEGRKEYLLPHMREVTNLLNDPKIVYQLQRYSYGGSNSKNPEAWVEDNIVKPLKRGNWGMAGQRANYEINVGEGDFRGQIIEEVRLAFRYWQGAGFEDEWKNTPVMGIDNAGHIVDDVVDPARSAQIISYRVVSDITPEVLTDAEGNHPYRNGFFGTECDDPFGSLRRPSQFIQGIKQKILPPLGPNLQAATRARTLAYELVRNINRYGQNWMSTGGIAIHQLYEGWVNSLSCVKDEVTGISFDQRPRDQTPLGLLPNTYMADFLAFSKRNAVGLDPVRQLWKKANNIDAANGPLFALALETKSPQHFLEYALTTAGPLIGEVAREPGEETGTRKALEAEVLLKDYIPAIAAHWISQGKEHRIFIDEIHSLFNKNKVQNLWFENNSNMVRESLGWVARKGLGDDSRGDERKLSVQGQKLRGILYGMALLADMIELGEAVVPGQTAGGVIKQIVQVAMPKQK